MGVRDKVCTACHGCQQPDRQYKRHHQASHCGSEFADRLSPVTLKMRLATSLSIAPDVSEALASLGVLTDTDLFFGLPPHELLNRLPPGTLTLRQLQGAIESISAASSSQGLSVGGILSSSAASSSHASTGLPDLDRMLGNGGFVEGRVYEISGDKRTGKTVCRYLRGAGLVLSNVASALPSTA